MSELLVSYIGIVLEIKDYELMETRDLGRDRCASTLKPVGFLVHDLWLIRHLLSVDTSKVFLPTVDTLMK